MSHNIQIDNALQMVDLKYTGTIGLEERSKARDEVFHYCVTQNIPRVLVDLSDSDIAMTESDVIKFASAFRNAELPHNYHLACVAREDNEVDKFLEILISLDGINVKYCINRDDAIKWLTAF